MNKLSYDVMQREYKLKFYLNAQHYITFNGKRGETHPHTWEFCLNIKMPRSKFVPFDVFEKEINSYFSGMQNQILNTIDPFTEIEPTLENMVDCFASELYEIIGNIGGNLSYVEGSEGPTRSYITRIGSNIENQIVIEDSDKTINSIIDQLINNSTN